MTVLDRYFELSDVAGQDQSAFQEVMDLFSEKAVLRPAGGSEVKGKEAIEKFLKGFFKRNEVMHHVWVTQTIERGLETSWAVAGKRKGGNVFALVGVDEAELDEQGKIRTSDVRFTPKDI